MFRMVEVELTFRYQFGYFLRRNWLLHVVPFLGLVSG